MANFFCSRPGNTQYFPEYSPKQPKNRHQNPSYGPIPEDSSQEKPRQQPGPRLPLPQAEGAVDPGNQAAQGEDPIGNSPVPQSQRTQEAIEGPQPCPQDCRLAEKKRCLAGAHPNSRPLQPAERGSS